MVSPLVVGILAALSASVFMYLDSKLFDEEKRKSTYFKNMVLCGGIAASTLYFLHGNSHSNLSTNSKSLVGGINEEILTGIPNF